MLPGNLLHIFSMISFLCLTIHLLFFASLCLTLALILLFYFSMLLLLSWAGR